MSNVLLALAHRAHHLLTHRWWKKISKKPSAPGSAEKQGGPGGHVKLLHNNHLRLVVVEFIIPLKPSFLVAVVQNANEPPCHLIRQEINIVTCTGGGLTVVVLIP